MIEKLVGRFSLADVLSQLAPGFVALIALRVLFGAGVPDTVGLGFSPGSLSLALTTLVGAYSIGLFLLEWVSFGTRLFFSLRMKHLALNANPLIIRRHQLWDWLGWTMLALLHGMPLPRMRRSFVEAQVMMSEFNENTSHTFESSRFCSPWDRLELFRKLVSRACLKGADEVLTCAADIHARLLFVLSLSLVFALAAIAGAVQFAVAAVREHRVDVQMILLIATAAAGSLMMRAVAARYWEMELMLVCSLAERRRI